MSDSIPVYMVPSPPDGMLRIEATHQLYRLATVIKAKAVTTSNSVSLSRNDAEMILTMAERALKMLSDHGFKV